MPSYVIPCDAMSCHGMHAMPCHVMSRHAMSNLNMSRHAMSNHNMSRHAMSNHKISKDNFAKIYKGASYSYVFLVGFFNII